MASSVEVGALAMSGCDSCLWHVHGTMNRGKEWCQFRHCCMDSYHGGHLYPQGAMGCIFYKPRTGRDVA